jgi:ADP-ribosylglycohydrolase
MTTTHDRIKGVLLGQAAGDALGAGYEFAARVAPKDVVMKGGGLGNWEPGQWTDDTEQAVIVARGGMSSLAVGQGLLDWYEGNPADVGILTSSVLGSVGSASDLPAQAAAVALARGEGTGTNGSLMRTGPVALPYLGDRGDDHEIAKAARQISSLTHADSYAGDACVLWSIAIDRAVRFGTSYGPYATLSAGLRLLPVEHQSFWERRIAEAVKWPEGQLRPNGLAADAFRAAAAAVCRTRDLESAVRLAVSFGHDTDTVAAIAGALAGARYGASAVPAGWREVLHGWPGMDADGLEELALEAAGTV